MLNTSGSCVSGAKHGTLEQQLVLNAAGALYRDALWRNPRARAYLAARGLPDWVIRACGLGYSDGRSLEAHLRKHGGLRIAEDLGLLRRPEPGEDGRMLRERFAGRIVIPELRGGQPIWFLGRHPGSKLTRVKYLGLPGEKPVLGFERAAGRREVFLTEGAFDWLTAVSWQLPAFSTCGTDFPSDRLGWLARARVIFGVLDGDRAGREAADRFGQALGRRWVPLELPGGSDLNDLGRQPGGRALFFRLVADARTQGSKTAEGLRGAHETDV
jgi:DNA primase